jgi:hypothetical protein
MNRQLMVRVTDTFVAAIDEWRRKELDLPSRSEALRRLAMAALKADAQPRPAKPAKPAKGRKG